MMVFGVPYQRRQILFVIGDIVLALAAILIAHALRFGATADQANLYAILRDTTGASSFFITTHLALLYVADGYDPLRDYRRPEETLRLFLAVLVALVVQMVLFYSLPQWWWGRGVVLLGSMVFAVLVAGWRSLVIRLRPAPASSLRTLIVGAGRAGNAMAEVIRFHHEYGRVYNLVGFIDDKVKRSESGLPVLGGAKVLGRLAQENRIDLLIVAIRGGMSQRLTQELLACKAAGLRIMDMPSLHKQLTGKVPIQHLADTWLIFGSGFSQGSRLGSISWRAADLILSLIGLILTGPIILVAALIVRLESPGPSFYTQERVGLGERPFTIIKLRTMRDDAEAGTGAVWSQGSGDPRVTRVGRFLRRSRIDELPQFLNVLRGDMSMVGPRPERAHFVCQLKESIPFYGLRFAVKPGVTGWAQVMYRYGASEEDAAEKLRYELFAIQEMSPVLYLLIVLKTVQTVLLRPGS